jgi:glycosyltransferase involved in cell wall biosynthesis
VPLEDAAASTVVSVVTPFLDAERFLADAIESVLAQTYSHWELLLVDDGSEDASAEVVAAYVERDSARIRSLIRPNKRNRSAARNHGIGLARGSVIAFLDADDVWTPRKLEQQVTLLEENPDASFVYGASEFWHSWTEEPADAERDYVQTPGFPADAVIPPPELLRLALESAVPTASISSIAVRKDALERVGYFEETFTAQTPIFEDQVFLAKLYLSETAYVACECWDRYRQHPDSRVAVATREGRKAAAGVAFCDWVAGYFAQQGVLDRQLWHALRKKRWRYRHPRLDRHGRALAHQAKRIRTYPRSCLDAARRATLVRRRP